ncbi:MAG: selenium-dependent molybdenum cofactor biosynthesis protein YqeB [Oscillospiraceae bacterium]|nr:selenium-dependent molybdenum cofactor biosynthesis protein YqeB [Oscillospiraceae bacterium]
MKNNDILDDIIIVRGGGDIATGAVQKFFRAGLKVLVLEIPRPTAIRREVSLCEAVSKGVFTVEDMTARLIESPGSCHEVWQNGEIPVCVDPLGLSIESLKPDGVINAILAKKNTDTHPGMAPVVVALGPGFRAPRDAHAVIETMRGHTLGKVIFDGEAIKNTGVPAAVGGKSADRVLYAPCDGTVKALKQIGDIVREGEAIFSVGESVVTAPFDGVLRGLIADGTPVPRGIKTADVDPRKDSDCRTITDKARCIGGGALEAYLYLRRVRRHAG